MQHPTSAAPGGRDLAALKKERAEFVREIVIPGLVRRYQGALVSLEKLRHDAHRQCGAERPHLPLADWDAFASHAFRTNCFQKHAPGAIRVFAPNGRACQLAFPDANGVLPDGLLGPHEADTPQVSRTRDDDSDEDDDDDYAARRRGPRTKKRPRASGTSDRSSSSDAQHADEEDIVATAELIVSMGEEEETIEQPPAKRARAETPPAPVHPGPAAPRIVGWLKGTPQAFLLVDQPGPQEIPGFGGLALTYVAGPRPFCWLTHRSMAPFAFNQKLTFIPPGRSLPVFDEDTLGLGDLAQPPYRLDLW